MRKKIDLCDITFDKEEHSAVLKVLESKWQTMGEITKSFEYEFGQFIGAEFVVAVNNCTSALHLAMIALGIGEGDEVIVPSLTFVATANAVLYTGAKPVFADITSLEDWTISSDSIEANITEKTKAISVVHYAGFPCNMTDIKDIAKKYNLFIIEDAAHGPGTWIDSKHSGTIGDIGCFSFFANKNMTSGEGGAFVTNNNDLAEKARNLRSHGMTSLSWDRYKGRATCYDVVSLGYNYRYDEMRAAIARVQLKKLEVNNKKRKDLTKYYLKHLPKISSVTVPFKNKKGIFSYHIFPILLDKKINRLNLMDKMRSHGIQTSIHYPPIHKMKIYKDSYSSLDLPNTEIVGNRELTLPLHPLLKYEDVDYIVDKLKNSI